MQTTLSWMEAVDICQNYVMWLQPQLEDDLEYVDEDIPMEETNFETAEDIASGELELDETCSEDLEGIGEQLETVVQHSVLSYPKSASLPNVPPAHHCSGMWCITVLQMY